MTTTMRTIVAVLVCSLSAIALAACGGGSSAPPASSPAALSDGASAVATARVKSDARITFLEARAAGDPLDVFSLNELAIEHMQRARETGDVAELARAGEALQRSLAVRRDDNYEAVALSAGLANTRHDFAHGEQLAREAIPQKPRNAYAYGALGDALIGLGRYDDAASTYEQMVTLEPDLPAFSRQALLFTLTGRLDDAERMWQATLQRTEGDDVPEHAGWAHAQLGNFYFLKGDVTAAGQQYEQSLAAFPGYVHALAGIGRVAAASGDSAKAIDYYTRAINTIPLPEYVVALGDIYAATGDQKHATQQYDLIGAIEQLYAANGVNLDLQIALFNADHDRNVTATVARARTAFGEQPSIQAADALAWVQYKAGDVDAARVSIEQALRTNTPDPLILFHAGMIYKASGDMETSKRYLERVENTNARFSVLYAETAKQALDDVSAQARGG